MALALGVGPTGPRCWWTTRDRKTDRCGASVGRYNFASEDVPRPLEWIEEEIDAFNEVMVT